MKTLYVADLVRLVLLILLIIGSVSLANTLVDDMHRYMHTYTTKVY